MKNQKFGSYAIDGKFARWWFHPSRDGNPIPLRFFGSVRRAECDGILSYNKDEMRFEVVNRRTESRFRKLAGKDPR